VFGLGELSAAGAGAVFFRLAPAAFFEVLLAIAVCLGVVCGFFDLALFGDAFAAFLPVAFAAGFRFAAFLDGLVDVLPAFFAPRLLAVARRFDAGTATAFAFALRLLDFFFLAVGTTYSFMT
jgi:hypothetical protein